MLHNLQGVISFLIFAFFVGVGLSVLNTVFVFAFVIVGAFVLFLNNKVL